MNNVYVKALGLCAVLGGPLAALANDLPVDPFLDPDTRAEIAEARAEEERVRVQEIAESLRAEFEEVMRAESINADANVPREGSAEGTREEQPLGLASFAVVGRSGEMVMLRQANNRSVMVRLDETFSLNGVAVVMRSPYGHHFELVRLSDNRIVFTGSEGAVFSDNSNSDSGL